MIIKNYIYKLIKQKFKLFYNISIKIKIGIKSENFLFSAYNSVLIDCTFEPSFNFYNSNCLMAKKLTNH